MSLTPDEAQLTAYLLGELTPEDAAQVEAQLAVSAALRDELAGLRQTVASLEAALAAQTPPAVPALDRQKLHSLLQSAVVTSHEPTVSAPALLATAPVQPARGSTSRGWLVAAAVLVVGGLVGLSQWESGAERMSLSAVSGPVEYLALVRQKEVEIANWQAAHLNESHVSEIVRDESARKVKEDSQKIAKLNQVVDVQQSLNFTAPQPSSQIDGQRATFTGKLPSDDQMQLDAAGARLLAASAAPPSPDGTVRGYALSENSLISAADPRFGFAELNKASARHRYALPQLQQPGNGHGTFDHDFWSFGKQRAASSGETDFSRESDFGTVTLRRSLAKGKPATDKPEVVRLYDSAGAVPLSIATGSVDAWDFKPDRLLLSEAEVLADGETRSKTHANSFILNVTDDLSSLHNPQPGDGPEPAETLLLAEQAPQSSSRPALTATDYESGLTQLGEAVKNWGEFSHHWYDDQSHESLARGAQAVESKHPASLDDDFDSVQDLSTIVAEQTRGLQELREKSPEMAGKPLAEANPEAAKQVELALVRVSRELQRQQQVWYYREGYVRQLEATLAAAEQYAHVPENDFVTPEAQPLSTFGIDVDTASYSNVRRFVESGQLPPPDAVRIEELINSFQYEGPKVEGEHPLAIAAEVSACPWQPQHQLLRVALKGKSIDLQQRPPARLVFLVDTSGSMSDENKLPLVKQSLRILVDQMREQDRLSIVTYSDNAGLLLDSTGGDKREAILAAIDGLVADGSTNGEAGLKLAYEVAVKQFGEGATNRVMLCTDGDFNVGESADSELVKLIEKQRQTGVFLNIFGFGSGNLKDAKLEAIADKGNGQYIYIDGIKEARKTLLNELTGTLYTIAKDVKLQIEFNPNLVGSYRLVGYENRAMAAKDFSNDKVDSGDMGAGHSVVALYEIVPPGAPQPVAPQPQVEPLKYKRAGSVSARSESPATPPAEAADVEAETPAPPADPVPAAEKPADPLATELCTIRVRYKQPTSNESTKIETVVTPPTILGKPLTPVSRDHVWATAVAQFGLLTRHSTFVGTGNYSQVLELAQSAIGEDPTGQRREFVTLVRQTQSVSFERERQLAEISRRAEEHRRVVEEIKTVEKAPDVMTKASCSGKYRTLLRRIEVADDQPTYGEFKDFGRWDGVTYKTHNNLPHGYWVYVAPHWYIWGESTEQAAVDAAK
jgi:Ca-activated chloride channel family protein